MRFIFWKFVENSPPTLKHGFVDCNIAFMITNLFYLIFDEEDFAISYLIRPLKFGNSKEWTKTEAFNNNDADYGNPTKTTELSSRL